MRPSSDEGAAIWAGRLSIFMASGSSMYLEVVLTRLLTALIFDRLYYLPLSMALLGLSAGGIVVSHRPRALIGRLAVRAWVASLVFVGLVLLVAWRSEVALTMSDPRVALRFFVESRVLLVCVFAGMTIIPFYALGMLIAELLRAPSAAVGVIYGFDLMGGALGVVAAVPVLNAMTSFNVLFLVPLGLTCVAMMWTNARLLMGFALALELVAAFTIQALDIPRIEARTLRTVVDAPNHVTVAWSARAYMEGYEREKSSWVVNQDHGSTVFVRPYEEGTFGCAGKRGAEACEAGLSMALVGAVRRPRSALVLAAGTGQQMIQCYVKGIESITGVEVNPGLTPLVESIAPAAHLAQFLALRGVSLVVDEARHYVERQGAVFDLIVVPSTYAAFQETVAPNAYLMTREAVHAYLDHLTPNGVILFEQPLIPVFSDAGRDEASDYLSLLEAGLMSAGLTDAQAHVIGVLSDTDGEAFAPPLQYVLISRAPWSGEERGRLDDVARGVTREAIIGDQSWSNEMWTARGGPRAEGLYRSFSWLEMSGLLALRRQEPRKITDDFPWLLERPLTFDRLFDRRNIMMGDPKALQVLGNLIAIGGVLILLILPLAGLPRGASWPEGALLPFFVLIGCGFMLTEIGLMDKLAFVLGSSTRSIVVCLSSLLVGAGIGGLCASAAAASSRRRGLLLAGSSIGLAVACLWSLFTWDQSGTAFLLHLGTSEQYALLAPSMMLLGFILGTPFPVGLGLLGRQSSLIPLAWGLNGAASVLAVNGAGLLQGTVHLSTLFLLAAASYVLGLIALAASVSVGQRARRRAAS